MADYTEEAHQRQSPYVLHAVEEQPGAPASRSVRTLRAWQEHLAASSDSLADPIGKRHHVDIGAWADRDPDRTKLAIRFVLPPDFDRLHGDDVVPGSVYVSITEFDPADARFLHSDEAGRERPIGATLRALRIALGGDEGVVLDPDGNPHDVSLSDWGQRDPDTTWLLVSFVHQQRSAPYRFHGSRGDTRWHWAAMDLASPPG